MKNIFLLIVLFTTIFMQAQERQQPKPGIAPKINIKKPQTFTLQNGLKIILVENHKFPRVVFNLTLDNPPHPEGDKKGLNSLTSSLFGNGTLTISKENFNEEIDFLGASLSFNNKGVVAKSLSKYSGRILELLSEGFLHPKFTQKEFDKEKEKLLESLRADEKSIATIQQRVVNTLAFGKNHPFGEILTPKTLNNITLDDVKKYYETYFVPENAYLVIVGDIKKEKVKPAVEKLFGQWKGKILSKNKTIEPQNVSKIQIDFVDMPNAVQSEITLVNTLKLKMNDPDYFATIIANQILGGDFNSYLNMNLREQNGWTYGAHSFIGNSKYVTAFTAGVAVRNTVTDSALVESIKEIRRIRTEKVNEEVLKNVKAGYVGRFVMKIENPQTIAQFALNKATQNLPDTFYENYIKSINKVTSDDVIRVAQKYFLLDNLRIVITGKASEVTPALQKLNIPIYYYDSYGNLIEAAKN